MKTLSIARKCKSFSTSCKNHLDKIAGNVSTFAKNHPLLVTITKVACVALCCFLLAKMNPAILNTSLLMTITGIKFGLPTCSLIGPIKIDLHLFSSSSKDKSKTK